MAASKGESGRATDLTRRSHDVKKQQCLLWLLVLAHLIGPHVSAEAQSVKAFEVASVRPAALSAQNPLSARVVGTRVDLVGFTPRAMITRAFQLPPGQGDRVVGTPDWATREMFEIRAVMHEGATEQDEREMLKTLLADRFGLRTHIEQRPYPVYELIVGPSGPRFPEVEAVDELKKDFAGEPGKSASDRISQSPDGELRSITRVEPDGLRFVTVTGKMRYSYKVVEENARQLDAERITMQELSRLLSVDRPVVDKTGLAGVYRLKMLLPPIPISARMQATLGDRVSADPPGRPSFSRAVEELGLKLEPKNTPVDHIVVDRIERPTPN
jgi:uncharacterized protein (TIGR03435 family)